MMLGIQWLATLGDIQCNFKKLIMKFNHKGRQLFLIGITNTHVHWMQGNKGMMKQAELSSMALCVYPAQLYQMESVGIVSAEISHDHQIPFMPNTPPINVRPYKYPPNQKDSIEGMVKELMDSRVIRASQSHFSSPIVMVNKKDGTWRICIDYRQLSKHIVKDTFPISVIEELIDELNGSIVFSKLDLRYGYHQIRMKEDDICKTAFRTHEGHYEFFVMPFGLTNAPSTFQSLMNTVFKAFLRKFVLVFFDGILIYSKNLKELCDHLAQVLHFKIKTDHFSLKYLLNQKLTTPFQFKWLPKLLGYDYEIVYKKGSENVVADALSRVDSSRELLQIISLENHSYKGNKYSWTGKILKRKEKVVVGNDPELRKELVQHFHDETIGGHSVAHVTMKKLGSLFYWKGLKNMVKQMIRDCDVCQRQKPDLSAYPGLIQPLPIPEIIWKEISMDFIEKLPTSHETSQVAQVFIDQVYKLHGLPEYITEVVNRSLGCYLRCICGEKPKEWVKWLPLAKFWYNTNYHTSTKTTPYEAVYCQTPPIHIPYILEDSRVEKVDRTLQAREEAIKALKFHLKRSQDRMRNQANKHRTDRQFEVGDWVYLKLQPHRQMSIRQGQHHKLSPKYYGPFKVAKRIGEVSYRLELPNSSQVHPVFYISQLKKCHGKDHSVGVLPRLREDGLLENKPMAILERRLGKVNNKPVMFVLIHWTNKSVEEATWKINGDLVTRFPGFDAVNETVL
nr:retrotransposable element Tf2 [Tanacetum cinerariifolium]